MSATESAPPPMPEFTSINVPNGGQVELVTKDKINPNTPVDLAERTLLDSTDPAKAVDALANDFKENVSEPPKPPDAPENTQVIDPITGESVDTLSPGDYEKSNENKTKERFDKNIKTELQKAQAKTDEEFKTKYPDAKTAPDGTPEDPAQLAEYVEMDKKNSEHAHSEAVRATVTQDYMDRNPKPDRKENPKKFDEWAKGLRDELDATEEMKKEISELEKGASNPEGKAEGVKDAVKEDEIKPESKDKDESSFMKALQLATQALANIGDKVKSKEIQEKIDRINDTNPEVKPSFKARVTIAKTLIIGGFLSANFATQLVKETQK